MMWKCVGNGQLHQVQASETVGALNCMHDQQILLGGYLMNESVAACDFRNNTENPSINGTLQSKENGGQSISYNNTVRQETVVRRLTPLECERLQGFPDNWTLIGEYDAEKDERYFIGTDGKRKKVSDSARYKALGNSIAIPFWFYLLRRIAAQYERPATLGSLFDGIGGFAYCWEMCNGKGTAIWASEIEEFCIAVTKEHFQDTTGE